MWKPKPTTMAAIAAATISLGAAGVGISQAASQNTGNNPMSNLVSAIATKFNLNQSEVQQVFDDQHKQMEAEHQQMMKDKLQQLVTDGKLTQEQADKITAKQQELQQQRETDHDALESKTPEERKAFMEAQRTALEQWAKDNNIPLPYLMMQFGRGGHGGPGMMHRFDKEVPAPQSSQAN